MLQSQKMNKQIIEEAAFWVTCLEDGPLEKHEREEFAAWMRASPKHIKEFLLARAISTEADAIDPDGKISIDDLLNSLDVNIIALETTEQPSTAPAPFWRSVRGIAASLFIVGATLLFVAVNLLGDDGVLYATTIGEQRSLVLEDGSVIHLNTRSKVNVRYGPKARRIDLLDGEALFDVAHNPARPFRVHAHGTMTEALGTSFNIYLKGDSTEVAVLEGKISLSRLSDAASTLLTVGEKASVASSGDIQAVKIANPDTIDVWRTRQLIFENTTLGEIVREFNRYNQMQIRIENIKGPEPRFSGVFNVNNPEIFLSTLEKSSTAVITRKGKNITIVRLSP